MPKKPATGEASKAPPAAAVSQLLQAPEVKSTNDVIEVNVDYQIVEQYSKHLYTNPRKAVEELACNSYDASADECWIQTPSEAGQPLLVLDNGSSMDIKDLKDLWFVAKSPKSDDPVHRIQNGRHQIGKFGVGKLAAFALGSRLTHIAFKAGRARIVSVDLAGLKQTLPAGQKGPQFRVFEVSEAKVPQTVGPVLGKLPKPWDKKWKTWTLAVVDEIDVANLDKPLDHAVLHRMIATALPVTANFKVHLDQKPVPRRTPEDHELIGNWKITDSGVVASVESALRKYYAERDGIPVDQVKKKDVDCTVTEIADPADNTEKIPALRIPGVGPIAGNAVGTKNILTTPKLEARGYLEHGFFVRVHDKLLNPEDNTFGIAEPFTYKYWHRCQISIEVPDLDAQILVQRNEVSGRDERPDIVREVLRGLFNFVRSKVQPYVKDAGELAPGPLFDRLTTHAPGLQGPILDGLQVNNPKWSTDDLEIDMVEAGDSAPPASFNAKTGHIEVNYSHPLPRELDLDKGKGKALNEVLAAIPLVAAYLRANQVPVDVIAGVENLMDAVARAAVNHIHDEFLYQKERLLSTQKKGDKPFEEAICDALVALGVGARPVSGSGQVDGLIEIIQPAAADVLLSMEAKGGDTKVDHDRADASTLSDHCDKRGGTSVVLVAKAEHLVVGDPKKPTTWTQLVTNCNKEDPPIVIVPLEALIRMLDLHSKNPFSREQLGKLLTTWVHPLAMEDVPRPSPTAHGDV